MSGGAGSKLIHAETTEQIVDAAMAVHRELGPGLLESTYEICLLHELAERGIGAERQVELPVVYRGVKLECGYKIDLMVSDSVVVEIKSVERLEPVHEAQLMSYLKLSGRRVGLLINFNVALLKHGIRRRVI
jgi:GxxExxY protein